MSTVKAAFVLLALSLVACQRRAPLPALGPTPTGVTITRVTPMSQVELLAGGGSFHDKYDPFWQASIRKDGITLLGAASPADPEPLDLPLVPPTFQGATTVWEATAGGQKVRIEATRVD